MEPGPARLWPAALPAVVDEVTDATVVQVADRCPRRRVQGGAAAAAALPAPAPVARAGDDSGDAGLVDHPAQREPRRVIGQRGELPRRLDAGL